MAYVADGSGPEIVGDWEAHQYGVPLPYDYPPAPEVPPPTVPVLGAGPGGFVEAMADSTKFNPPAGFVVVPQVAKLLGDLGDLLGGFGGLGVPFGTAVRPVPPWASGHREWVNAVREEEQQRAKLAELEARARAAGRVPPDIAQNPELMVHRRQAAIAAVQNEFDRNVRDILARAGLSPERQAAELAEAQRRLQAWIERTGRRPTLVEVQNPQWITSAMRDAGSPTVTVPGGTPPAPAPGWRQPTPPAPSPAPGWRQPTPPAPSPAPTPTPPPTPPAPSPRTEPNIAPAQPDSGGILRIADALLAALPPASRQAFLAYLRTLGYQTTGVMGVYGPVEFKGSPNRIWVDTANLPTDPWLRWAFYRLGWADTMAYPGFNAPIVTR